ncbi:MAG: prepilin-type N-terminal cleavage/methylation domain-containing protein [Defluviitaleaceae bacterium]|nr:prepilin-type N-terminal cleavage/methylation domain-containing protein [Defluviitaleaceae bacterium]
MKHLNNKKGVTLMELIVAILVFSIIMAATTSIFGPMLNSFRRANNMAEANTIMNDLVTLIFSDVRSAVENPGLTTPNAINLQIGDTLNNDILSINTQRFGVITFGVEDGQITRTVNNEPIIFMDDGFYRGLAVIGFNWEWHLDSGLFELEIEVTHPDGWERTRTYTTRPLGLAP